jgi:hypothetical protein
MGAAEEAVELKEKGNKAFKEHDWPKAISFYTQAIDKNDQEPAFFTNRAQVSCLKPARHATCYCKQLTQRHA